MNFFKTMLASMLGAFLALGLLFLLFVFIIIAAISSAGSEKSVVIKENSVLHIKLNDPIVERANDKNFNFSLGNFDSKQRIGLNQFIKDLEAAQEDDKIKGIFLEVGSVVGAPSSMHDLHNAIVKFKNTGKWVIAFSEGYSQGGYYIASAANEVYLYPTGEIDWRGINAEIMFYKKLLDKLEIEAQVVRGPNNKFKSAVEPFIYDHMSDENRAQVKTFIDDIWMTMLEGIAEQRGLDVAALNSAADSLDFLSAGKALEARVVDGLMYRDEVVTQIRSKLGIVEDTTATKGTDNEKDELPFVSLADYHSGKKRDKVDFEKGKIAVVYAVGAIESGEGDDETIGSDRIAAALKKAREDEKVKAIVLRVNSPGGSALASDVIWRETQLIKQKGKPFVVSMGDYAASGGYYISCGADKIYANRNTITGSIGVFGILPNMQKFLDNKLGLTFDRFETNPHADIFSASKPLDKKEMQAMQSLVADIYDDFTRKVADGRKKTQAEVDSIGQGRVWSGEDAKNIGLVDEIGDLNAAVAAAASMAGIEDYRVSELPELIDPLKKMIEQVTGQKQSSLVKEWLGDNFNAYNDLMYLTRMKGPQARLPFFIQIK
ncbi:MAG: signal peptide peptidase SppA [Crocinitomicaceae bacterium]|nr:signal peptide peptidase SppA [Crocinitomicaceae bacterium]